MPTRVGTRDGYHHGDLRNALVAAGVALARGGGPDAVVLRAVAREVGVSATAAYRHFEDRDALIEAVAFQAREGLAETLWAEVRAGRERPDPIEEALRRFRALGTGYLRFALAEPGLFRVAFCATKRGAADLAALLEDRAFRMLRDALDVLVAHGLLDAERREFAEFSVLAGVHGLAELLLDGMFDPLPEEARQVVVDRTIDLIEEGLCGRVAEFGGRRGWVRGLYPVGD